MATLTLQQGIKAGGGGYRYSSSLSLTSVLHAVSPQRHTPDRFTPGKEAQYPLYSRLSGP
jgi:hypothetical protein